MTNEIKEGLQGILKLALEIEVKKSELQLLLCGCSVEDSLEHYKRYQDRIFYLLREQQGSIDCIVATSRRFIEEENIND